MIRKKIVKKANQYTSHIIEMYKQGYSFKEELANDTPDTVVLVFEKDNDK